MPGCPAGLPAAFRAYLETSPTASRTSRSRPEASSLTLGEAGGEGRGGRHGRSSAKRPDRAPEPSRQGRPGGPETVRASLETFRHGSPELSVAVVDEEELDVEAVDGASRVELQQDQVGRLDDGDPLASSSSETRRARIPSIQLRFPTITSTASSPTARSRTTPASGRGGRHG